MNSRLFGYFGEKIMKAILFEKIGGPLKFEEVMDPVVKEGEIFVEIHAASVNPADHKVREGFYGGGTKIKFPHISGRDFSGVVRVLGVGVSDFAVGDEVFGVLDVGHEGTYAEFVTEKAEIIAKKPDFFSHTEASAIALTGLTALVSLEDTAKIQAGEKLLIQGGAGGVGSFAVQLAHHLGAHVSVTASLHNHDYLRNLGADELIDYNRVDFRDVVTNCDAVYDTVGGEVHRNSYDTLRPGGRMVYIAPQPKDFEVPRDDVTVLRPKVGRARTYLERIIELAERGIVIPPEIETMSLSEAAAAQEKSKTGHVRGKVVLEVWGSQDAGGELPNS